MDYSKFRMEDFATDEYFIKWVKRPDDETNAFWNAWLSRNPKSIDKVRKAREIILNLDFQTNVPPEGKFLEVWDKIDKADSNHLRKVQTSSVDVRINYDRRRWVYAIAAAVLVLLVTTVGLLSHKFRTVTIHTTYGESRTVVLPDSTKVTLNSNSTVSYVPAHFADGRAVSLEGEAFFSVVHKDTNDNFIVHTDELNVEVLGTKFNVNSRRGHTRVILKEGKVKLNMNKEEKEENLVMAPGEYVEFTNKGELTRKTVDANDYLEWRNNRLIFVGTSLSEIGQLLEDNYGYQVIFEDEVLKERKFTGSSSAVEIEELLTKLSRLYNLEIKRDGNKILLNQTKEMVPNAIDQIKPFTN